MMNIFIKVKSSKETSDSWKASLILFTSDEEYKA